MKKAIVYFEGKEVCRVDFQYVHCFEGIEFYVDAPEGSEHDTELVASFPSIYGCMIIKEHKVLTVSREAILKAFNEKQ